MSYNHKIIELKYHLKELINQDVCNKLINFYETYKHMTLTEKSYKYNEDKIIEDNCNFLNLSLLKDKPNFDKPFEIILKYLNIMVTNYEIYVRNNFCPNYVNKHMTHTDNIRIIKYDVGQCIADHSDIGDGNRGSVTINLNDDYEGGKFRFFGGRLKVNLSAGEAMLFPAEPIWIHGTEPVTKGCRYAINCFLK
jgi:hypothetical protein